MAEIVSPSVTLPDGSSRPVTCGQCGTTTFKQETAKMEGRWGMTQHKATLLVCAHCSHVETFYSTRVIFMQAN
jgi:hypothetical protein